MKKPSLYVLLVLSLASLFLSFTDYVKEYPQFMWLFGAFGGIAVGRMERRDK